jgi:AraC-like DNA-binding protein
MAVNIEKVKLNRRDAAEELLRRDPGMDAELLRRADFFDEDALPLCVFRMPYKFNIGFRAAHTHEFDEMMIVTGGTAIHQYNGETVPMRRGDVFLIPEGQRHGYAMPPGCRMEIINLLFDLSALGIDWGDLAELDGFKSMFAPILKAKKTGAVAPFPPPLRLSPGVLALVSSLINSIESELANEADGYRFFAKSYFSKVVGILSRVANHVPFDEKTEADDLSELAAYLEENLGAKITPKEMAQFSGVSESHLRRRFQEVYVESPMHYLQRIRIERSMEMLADPSLSITDIACDIGMGDSNYFSRIFRKFNECSPSQYREKLKQDLASQLLRT